MHVQGPTTCTLLTRKIMDVTQIFSFKKKFGVRFTTKPATLDDIFVSVNITVPDIEAAQVIVDCFHHVACCLLESALKIGPKGGKPSILLRT